MEENVIFGFRFQSTIKGNRSRTLEVPAEAEPMEEGCSLFCCLGVLVRSLRVTRVVGAKGERKEKVSQIHG